jgi:hypothetical protein
MESPFISKMAPRRKRRRSFHGTRVGSGLKLAFAQALGPVVSRNCLFRYGQGLSHERMGLFRDWVGLCHERDGSFHNRGGLFLERMGLVHDSDQLFCQWDNLFHDRDGLFRFREGIRRERYWPGWLGQPREKRCREPHSKTLARGIMAHFSL